MRLWSCILLVALVLLSPLLAIPPNHDVRVGPEGPAAPPEQSPAGGQERAIEERPQTPMLLAENHGGGPRPEDKARPRPAQPYVHEGDLILDDNDYLFLGYVDFHVIGNVIIKDSAMLWLDHVTFFINQSYANQYGIYVMDSGLLKSFDSRIFSNFPFNITCEDLSSLDAYNTRLECSMTCKDSALISLKNCTAFTVSCYGGITELLNGTSANLALAFYGSTTGSLSVSPGEFSYWSLSDNTTITGASFRLCVEDATVTGWSLCIGGSANIEVSDSELMIVNCRDTARLNMSDTGFGGVICSRHSHVRLVGCSGSVLSCMNFTHVEVRDSDVGLSLVLEGFSPDGPLVLQPGEVDEFSIEHGLSLHLVNTYVRGWELGLIDSALTIEDSSLRGLSCYGSTEVEVRNATIIYVFLEGTSRADIYKSTLSSAYCYGSSRLRLFGTSLLPLVDVGDYAEVLVFWYLDVRTTLAGEPRAGAEVSVYFANSSLADSKTTGSDGLATFLLMEKRINSTGEWPLGPYHIVASYDLYEEEADVELTDNMAITLELGFELKVRCVDGDGDWLSGALVIAGGLSALTGPDGWALIDGLKAETTTVEVLVWGVKVAEVLLVWGSNFTGDVAIEPLECAVYDVNVLVRYEDGRPAAKVLVTLLWLNETGIMTLSTNSTGWAVFENIPAGSYKVKAVKEGYEDVEKYILLEVEDQLVQITLRPAKPGEEGGPGVPWNILTYAVVASMAFIVAVAVVASLRRRKAVR